MQSNRRLGRGRRGLFARVLERRRIEATSAQTEDAPNGAEVEAAGPEADRIAALESRLDRLESLVEGLQDAMYRDAVRRGREIQDLEQKTAPDQMSRSLAEHDRRHGL
jgi:hypothetical protein